MIVEVWVLTVTPGKDAEFQEWSKRRGVAAKRQLPTINSRLMKPATGKANKYIATSEFQSYEERYSFWNNFSDELKALVKERVDKELLVPGSGEHYFYDVIE